MLFTVLWLTIMAHAHAGASNDAGLPDPPALPAGPLGGSTATGTFTGTEPTMPNRVFRNGTASDCGAPKPFPGTLAAVVPYQVITLYNSGSAQCVTMQYDVGTCNAFGIFFTAYSGNFSPANLATNYLGDAGVSSGSGSFSFMAPGGPVAIMVSGVVGGTALSCTYSISSAQLSGGDPAVVPALAPALLWLVAAGVLALGLAVLGRRAA